MRDFIKIEKDRINFLDARFYQRANGNFYPSCTTILDAYPKSAAFFEWLKKNGEDSDEIRDEAGRKGSVVHQLCEDLDNGKEVTMATPEGEAKYKQIVWATVDRYVQFRTRFPEYELVVNEVHYISPALGFAGTLDRVFDLNGKKVLVDIKTSNALHNHFWLQLAAYKALWDEVNPDEPIDEIRVLWLGAQTRTEKTGTSPQGVGWQLKEPEYSIEHYWRLFQNVFATWQEENKSIKPKNTSYKLTQNLYGTKEINRQVGDLQESIK